jgi:flagellin-like protein
MNKLDLDGIMEVIGTIVMIAITITGIIGCIFCCVWLAKEIIVML